MTRALIVVDVQNDFCEGGSLPVEGGAAVAARINEFVRDYDDHYTLIVASKDFHLSSGTNGGHFAEPGSDPDYVQTWPAHCVQMTDGSEFHSNFSLPLGCPIIYKGKGHAAYSAFEGETTDRESLDELLQRYDTTNVDVVGIATDYCVQATALDAVKHGYATTVLLDLTAAVAGEAGRSTATRALVDAGAVVINTDLMGWTTGAMSANG